MGSSNNVSGRAWIPLLTIHNSYHPLEHFVVAVEFTGTLQQPCFVDAQSVIYHLFFSHIFKSDHLRGYFIATLTLAVRQFQADTYSTK